MNRKRQVTLQLTGSLTAISVAVSLAAGSAFARDTRLEPIPGAVDSAIHRGAIQSPARVHVDELDTYMEDLSAFGKSARIAPPSTPVPKLKVSSVADQDGPAALNVAALRILFHSGEFNAIDPLDTYTEDLSALGEPGAVASTGSAGEASKDELLQTDVLEPALNAQARLSLADSTTASTDDDLDAYTEDLSAFGTFARIAASQPRKAGTRSESPQATQPQEMPDLAALRAWMHSSEFIATDDLGTYMEDFSAMTPVATASAEGGRAEEKLSRFIADTEL